MTPLSGLTAIVLFLLLSWGTRCSLSSISIKVQSYAESTTCCWPVILTLSLNFLTCKVQVTVLLPTAALKGRDCAEGLCMVQDSINATYSFNTQRESRNETQEAHVDPVRQFLMHVVQGQLFVRELAHEFMTSTTETR